MTLRLALAVNEPVPMPSELKADIDQLKQWVDGVEKRRSKKGSRRASSPLDGWHLAPHTSSLPIKEVVDRVVRLNASLARFWGNSKGWTPSHAASDFAGPVPDCALYQVVDPTFINDLDPDGGYSPDPTLNAFTGWLLRRVSTAAEAPAKFLSEQPTLVRR